MEAGMDRERSLAWRALTSGGKRGLGIIEAEISGGTDTISLNGFAARGLSRAAAHSAIKQLVALGLVEKIGAGVRRVGVFRLMDGWTAVGEDEAKRLAQAARQAESPRVSSKPVRGEDNDTREGAGREGRARPATAAAIIAAFVVPAGRSVRAGGGRARGAIGAALINTHGYKADKRPRCSDGGARPGPPPAILPGKRGARIEAGEAPCASEAPRLGAPSHSKRREFVV
jgi:hypothetical protein